MCSTWLPRRSQVPVSALQIPAARVYALSEVSKRVWRAVRVIYARRRGEGILNACLAPISLLLFIHSSRSKFYQLAIPTPILHDLRVPQGCCRIVEMPSIVKWPVRHLSGWECGAHRGPGGGYFSHSFSCLQVALQGPSNNQSPPRGGQGLQ
jgi:hypothetical protein